MRWRRQNAKFKRLKVYAAANINGMGINDMGMRFS
jgi:hypothetical protein